MKFFILAPNKDTPFFGRHAFLNLSTISNIFVASA